MIAQRALAHPLNDPGRHCCEQAFLTAFAAGARRVRLAAGHEMRQIVLG